ncbi:DUF1877 family protein [Streptomyces sp. NPDC060243]|uniref:DUF1877 family protein n=1 Tax=Streptomyces sp. NPDC060243 TaxID=3347081 RepID=UPI0036629B9D
MAVALYLRRFKADDLPTSAEAAIEALPDACPPDRRRAEEESRVLMNLGEQWNLVLAALAGADDSPDTLGYQAALGGDLLGETGTEIVTYVSVDGVRRIAASMSSTEGGGQAWVARHLDAVVEAFGADVDADFQQWLATRVDDLAEFYAAAAAEGDVVVKMMCS